MIAFKFGVPKKELKSGEKAGIQREDWNIWIEEFLYSFACVTDQMKSFFELNDYSAHDQRERVEYVKNDWNIFKKCICY